MNEEGLQVKISKMLVVSGTRFLLSTKILAVRKTLLGDHHKLRLKNGSKVKISFCDVLISQEIESLI